MIEWLPTVRRCGVETRSNGLVIDRRLWVSEWSLLVDIQLSIVIQRGQMKCIVRGECETTNGGSWKRNDSHEISLLWETERQCLSIRVPAIDSLMQYIQMFFTCATNGLLRSEDGRLLKVVDIPETNWSFRITGSKQLRIIRSRWWNQTGRQSENIVLESSIHSPMCKVTSWSSHYAHEHVQEGFLEVSKASDPIVRRHCSEHSCSAVSPVGNPLGELLRV